MKTTFSHYDTIIIPQLQVGVIRMIACTTNIRLTANADKPNLLYLNVQLY